MREESVNFIKTSGDGIWLSDLFLPRKISFQTSPDLRLTNPHRYQGSCDICFKQLLNAAVAGFKCRVGKIANSIKTYLLHKVVRLYQIYLKQILPEPGWKYASLVGPIDYADWQMDKYDFLQSVLRGKSETTITREPNIRLNWTFFRV